MMKRVRHKSKKTEEKKTGGVYFRPFRIRIVDKHRKIIT